MNKIRLSNLDAQKRYFATPEGKKAYLSHRQAVSERALAFTRETTRRLALGMNADSEIVDLWLKVQAGRLSLRNQGII